MPTVHRNARCARATTYRGEARHGSLSCLAGRTLLEGSGLNCSASECGHATSLRPTAVVAWLLPSCRVLREVRCPGAFARAMLGFALLKRQPHGSSGKGLDQTWLHLSTRPTSGRAAAMEVASQAAGATNDHTTVAGGLCEWSMRQCLCIHGVLPEAFVSTPRPMSGEDVRSCPQQRGLQCCSQRRYPRRRVGMTLASVHRSIDGRQARKHGSHPRALF